MDNRKWYTFIHISLPRTVGNDSELYKLIFVVQESAVERGIVCEILATNDE